MGLCFSCKKNFSAVTYERKTKDGVVEEAYCYECYGKHFLSAHVDGHANGRQYDACPYCGWTAEALQRTALVGCSHCYHTLGGVAIPMVIRMQQGQDVHQGKAARIDRKTVYENRKKELIALVMHYGNLGDEQRVKEYKSELEKLARSVGVGDV